MKTPPPNTFPKEMLVMLAHKTFERAETSEELFSAAIKAKAGGDESLLQRFEEIMASGGTQAKQREENFSELSEQELEDLLSLFDASRR